MRARRAQRAREVAIPPELTARRELLSTRLYEILGRIPARSPLASSEVPAHPGAANIEARLLSGFRHGALLAAEELLLQDPADPRVHVLLARVLIHCDDPGAARRELARARRLGAIGVMSDYLEARLLHLHLQEQTRFSKGEHVFNSSATDLITPFELFMLELDRQHRRPRKAFTEWLQTTSSDPGKSTANHNEVVALLTQHFSAYYDCLDKLVSAVQREPAFTDALYHLARMALKVGLIREGQAMMEKIEPLMFASTEKLDYERDLSHLRADETAALISALVAPATDRRSVRVIARAPVRSNVRE
jgi:hypothetical protein